MNRRRGDDMMATIEQSCQAALLISFNKKTIYHAYAQL